MARLPWTKFQDFYLRLGFLKVLVAILDANRRSAASEVLCRRIQQLLFLPARGYGDLWRHVEKSFPWFEVRVLRPKSRHGTPVTLLEALLLLGECPSQLYAVTGATAYKIVDWARDLQLIGAGNQISETGVLLKGLLPQEAVSEFLRGDPLAWNPFILTERERLLVLFHLCEVDDLTIELLDELSRPNLVESIESADAAAMTCRAFFRVLDHARGGVGPVELPALRRAQELASVMAQELGLENLLPGGTATRRKLPKPLKIPTRSGAQAANAVRQQRRTTKNADHQTIPRFEQLVDLGFLSKPIPVGAGPEEEWEARRRWRYERLASCNAWAKRRRESLDGSEPWEWRAFAAAALVSGVVCARPRHERHTPELLAGFLWNAYQAVHRQVGHTPFHSVALIAMIEAVVAGFAIEMKDFHDLMLVAKRKGVLGDHVFFASGNEIDKMFLLVRPGFVEAVKNSSAVLQAVASS